MGSHERTAEHRTVAPPPEVPAGLAPPTLIPQRERVTFLVHLARRFRDVPGVVAAYSLIENYMVLNVIPVDPRWRALTVGLCYVRGEWWFYNIHTSLYLAPANELDRVGHQIRHDMERVGT